MSRYACGFLRIIAQRVYGDFAGRFSNNNKNNKLIAAVICEREQIVFPALTVASVETVFSDGSLKSHPLYLIQI